MAPPPFSATLPRVTAAPPDPWLSKRAADVPALLVVGCMNFGGRTKAGDSKAIVERAVERGLRCFDTANMYGNGESERLVGRALAKVPDARIATKVGLLPVKGRPEGLAPERVLRAVDESLDRLGRPSVELLYLHAPDRATPLGETLGAIAELLQSGRIRHFGVSNYAAWELVELMQLCDARGMPRPRTSQVLLNLAIRQIEIEYVRFAASYGLHTTVYNPLAGGLFARPLQLDAPPPPGSRFETNRRYRDRYWSERLFTFADACRALAAEAGLTLVDLAYGWLAEHPGVDSILAGPGTVAHLDAAVDALRQPLPPALVTRVAALQRAFDGTDASYAR
jgi:aryl-alcohol dehydrogenase-like predicted oxidoreductase